MKRLTQLTTMAFGLLFLVACQKEEIASPGAKISNRAASWTHSPVSPCAGEDFTVTYCNGLNNSCGFIQIQKWDEELEDWVQVVQAAPVNGCRSYTVLAAEEGTHLFRGRWQSTGSPTSCPGANQSFTEYEVSVVACGCDESLEAEVSCTTAACNRSVTFTYTAGDDHDDIVIQGGLTHFTTICTATATGGLVQNTTHPSLENSMANVTRWQATGVEECNEYTVTISWTSTNNDPFITGEWTVKDGDGNLLAYLCPLNCAGESAETCE